MPKPGDGENSYKESRRGIDYFTAEKWVRIDERLKNVETKAVDAYEEIFGGKNKVGLGEQLRAMLKVWGILIAITSTLLGSWTWIYDKLSNKHVFGEPLHEKWKKESTKRIRLYNKEKGAWEYYYMIEEEKAPQIEDSKE